MKQKQKRFHDGKTGAAITLSLEYGADKTRVVKILKDGTVRMKLASKTAGKNADEELILFLANKFLVNIENFEILAGSDSKKLVSVIGVSPEEIDRVLFQLAD